MHKPVATVDIDIDDDINDVDDIDDVEEESHMTLGAHLDELRTRLIKCLKIFGATFFVGMLFYSQMWTAIRLPVKITANYMEKTVEQIVKFQSLRPLGQLTTVMHVTFFLALAVSLPVILSQLWSFVSPGLKEKERRALSIVFSAGSILFLAGAAVAFFIAVPVGLKFLLEFNESIEGIDDVWQAGDYLSFLLMCCVGFGVCFETPLVMMALAKVGLITPKGILKYWRHSVVAMMVLGALLTPPDPFTQVMMATMMIVLFFTGYFLARWTCRKK